MRRGEQRLQRGRSASRNSRPDKTQEKMSEFREKVQIDAHRFFGEYHGHPAGDLQQALDHFKGTRGREAPVLWLAGDSSLDNKHWFEDTAAAINGWEDILTPPTVRKDVAYYVSKECVSRKLGASVFNCAIEESCVGDRSCGRLMRQDRFIADNIGPNDTLVVSVGGNDIALKYTPCTVLNMFWLMCCVPQTCIESTACGCSLPCDDCCLGCGPSCLSNFLACPPGAGYFLHLFKTRIEHYLTSLVAKCKPKKVLVCMIYYPDEKQTGSWADTTLGVLGYNSNPAKLQALIRLMFKHATQNIRIPGVEVEAVPLFEAMDGRDTRDYCQRVEPSPKGSAKMAKIIMDYACGGGARPAEEEMNGR